MHFDLDVGSEEALGCLSETMILTAIGWTGHYSLGKADPTQAAHITAMGRLLGFRLAPFRNSVGYVTEEDLHGSLGAHGVTHHGRGFDLFHQRPCHSHL